MNPISIILGFFTGSSQTKLIAIVCGAVAVALVVVGLFVKIAFLNADISNLKGGISAINGTLVTEQGKRANAETRANLAMTDKEQLLKVVSGLQGQLEAAKASKRKYIKRLAQAQEIDRKAVTVKKEQTSGVIDDATSNATIDFFNAVFLRTKNFGNSKAASAGY